MSLKNLFRGKINAHPDSDHEPVGYANHETHKRPSSEPEQESAPAKASAPESVKAEEVIIIHNLMILDESGSMNSIYDAALTGANETIQSIRSAQNEYANQDHRFTFVTFNTSGENVKTVLNDVPITDVRDLTKSDYRPNACTPLYDAMGKALTTLERRVTEEDRVLVTIITDGMENASQEYSGKMIKEMVERLREKGWTFVYIGANQDSVEVARDLNINNAMNFKANSAGTGMMYKIHREKSKRYYEKMSRFGRGFSSEEDFFEDKISNRITPRRIDVLEPNQILVFESNIRGEHRHGIAELAYQRHGAVWGQASGAQGQCYAIPLMPQNPQGMIPYINDFFEHVRQHPELTFLVTEFNLNVMDFIRLFADGVKYQNVCFPEVYWSYMHK